MLAIAYLVGNDYFNHASIAAIHLSNMENEPLSLSVELLQDIRTVFNTNKIDRIYTEDLISKLCANQEAPWLSHNNGKPITAAQLAKILKEFNISSKDMRLPPLNELRKDYSLEYFKESFSRYLPSIATFLPATTLHHNSFENKADDIYFSPIQSVSCRAVALSRCRGQIH